LSDFFKNITIVGVGVIGGSLGLALKRKNPKLRITGVSSPKTIEKALEMGAIDIGYPHHEIEKGLAEADLVFICTSISLILEYIPFIAQHIQPGTVVTDVGSTKQIIVNKAESCFALDKYFIGGHPMAGNEGKGISWADRFLFENAVYVLSPAQNTPEEKIQSLGNLLETTGAKVLLLPPDLHDRVAATVSHLPQIVSIALMNLVSKSQDESSAYLKLAAGGFRDMTRIASSPYEMWRDIFETNQDNICQLLDGIIDELKSLKSHLVHDEMAKLFESAASARLSIPRDTKGFLRPNFDLSVEVEDKPGEIASIASSMIEKNINIKDIEVLKVREGDSGTIRLSFETEQIRIQAKKLLEKTGFTAHVKQ